MKTLKKFWKTNERGIAWFPILIGLGLIGIGLIVGGYVYIIYYASTMK